jgi:ketosteroid isomerase-like protein
MPDSLLPGDGQDLIARFKNARQKRNPDKMLELFAEDAEYRYHPFEPALIGANAIREYWNRVAAEQTHVDFDAERTWVAGNTVFSSWHSAHTLELTAERIRERGFSTAELDEDGQITRLRDWPTYKSIGVDSRHHPDPLPQEAGE